MTLRPYIRHRPKKQHWSVFPSDTALLKALYPATTEISKKWTMPLRDWGKVFSELAADCSLTDTFIKNGH